METPDLKTWLPTLLSELHVEHFKPVRFRKQGRTFSRDTGSYVERFNFQGSSSNTAGASWRFYVNVGIEFKDLPERKYWSLFGRTHWAGRMEQLVPGAPVWWDYDENSDRRAFKEKLARLISEASATLAGRSTGLREDYVSRLQGTRPGWAPKY